MTIRLKTILTPIDFSHCSEEAVDYAVALARVFDAELHLLHVIDDPILTAGTTHPEFREDIIEKADRKLEVIAGRHSVEGIEVKTAVKCGSAFYEIIEHAREINADVIVISSHGHGPVKHLLLGSQAEKVVRSAPCPVLTVRPNQHQFVMP